MGDLLFGYGTLKRGGELGSNYMRGAKFIGDATVKGYKLYTNGSFPYMVKSPDSTVDVIGEVFEVSDFSNLDKVEGYNAKRSPQENLYNRELIKVNLNGVIKEVYAYIYSGTLRPSDKEILDGEFVVSKFYTLLRKTTALIKDFQAKYTGGTWSENVDINYGHFILTFYHYGDFDKSVFPVAEATYTKGTWKRHKKLRPEAYEALENVVYAYFRDNDRGLKLSIESVVDVEPDTVKIAIRVNQ